MASRDGRLLSESSWWLCPAWLTENKVCIYQQRHARPLPAQKAGSLGVRSCDQGAQQAIGFPYWHAGVPRSLHVPDIDGYKLFL